MRDERAEFLRRIAEGLQRRAIMKQEAARREKRLQNEARDARSEHIARAAHRNHIKNKNRGK